MAETKIKEQGLGAGAIVQIVSASYSTAASTSGTTFVDTGLTVNITPKYSNSKLLISVRTGEMKVADASTGVGVTLFRGTTGIVEVCKYACFPTANSRSYASATTIDEPNTTSQVTYKTQFKRTAGTGSVTHCEDSTTAYITIMEIKQ